MFVRPRRAVSLFESLESRTLLSAQGPYHSSGPAAIPGTIEVENYDTGGKGVAYHETTGGNSGGKYRSDDVDIAAGGSNGFHVTNIAAGEWLEYTVNVTDPGTYRVDISYATSTNGGQVHISFDGSNKTGWMPLTNTGGDTKYKTASNSKVVLPGGTHVMRLMIDKANVTGELIGNIDSITITQTNGDGGTGGSGGTSTSFKPKSFTWKSVATNPLQREEAQSLVYDGYLYEFGGFLKGEVASREVDRYDPVKNKWKRMHDMPYASTHAAVAPDPDGHDFWFLGGFEGSFKHNPPVGPAANALVYKYNAETDTWTKKLSLPAARGAGGAGIVDGKLYFFSGINGARTHEESDTYMLDLGDQSAGWKDVAKIPNPRNHLGGITVNGKIYAIGGQHSIETSSVAQREVDRFDPSNDTWTRVADLPTPLSHYNAATVLYDRYIITVGGENPHNVAKAYVYAYDTVLNKWAKLTNLPDPRRAGVAGLIGNKLIQSSGYDAGKETSTTYIADLSDVFT